MMVDRNEARRLWLLAHHGNDAAGAVAGAGYAAGWEDALLIAERALLADTRIAPPHVLRTLRQLRGAVTVE